MVVKLKPETESLLQELAAASGRSDDLVEYAMSGYLEELSHLRARLDKRYDQVKSGEARPVDGDEAFARLRKKNQIASIHDRIRTSS